MIERIYPNDERVKPQTIAHHKARYELAANLQPGGGRALDLGSGTGYGSQRLSEAGYTVMGIDKSVEAVSFARANYPGVFFVRRDITELALGYREMANFRLITFFEVLEHLDFNSGINLLAYMPHALTNGGKFVMSIPRDINEANNGFHQSQWDYEMLTGILKSVFDRVTMLGQDWDTAAFSPHRPQENDFFVAVCEHVHL